MCFLPIFHRQYRFAFFRLGIFVVVGDAVALSVLDEVGPGLVEVEFHAEPLAISVNMPYPVEIAGPRTLIGFAAHAHLLDAARDMSSKIGDTNTNLCFMGSPSRMGRRSSTFS